MKKLLLIMTAVLLFGSSSIVNAAVQKIAVVDVAAVVEKSAQVQSLKKEQAAKIRELEKWLQSAKADVEKQTIKADKEKLLKKYNDEFAKKREVIAANYQIKLKAIDKSISDTIASQAKLKGYDMVITKGIVLYGGDDITADIQRVVK